MMKFFITESALLALLCLGLALPSMVPAAQDHGDEHAEDSTGVHSESEAHEEHEEGALAMSAAERKAQGIQTTRVAPRALADVITAPGEVRINAYTSAQVTPRISAQVIARHARLGEQVEKDQPLVTFSSVAMAEAQGALVETDREWKRVRKLGRKVVSDKRYISAQVARQRAYATVLAYGMTEAQIKQLLAGGDASQATGEFDLLSPQAGTVIRDDFVLGELVTPGTVLFVISDESILWVEAMLNPQDATRVEIGAKARVSVDGKQWLEGKVVQLHHRLDETTRTQSIRIEVDNSADRLHPGQFVQTAVQSGTAKPVVAVPGDAVVLLQGSPTVFKVEGDELHPQPVETGVTRAGYTEIRAGLAEGEEIVVQGAFLLKSLLLKSQMGEGHAH